MPATIPVPFSTLTISARKHGPQGDQDRVILGDQNFERDQDLSRLTGPDTLNRGDEMHTIYRGRGPESVRRIE